MPRFEQYVDLHELEQRYSIDAKTWRLWIAAGKLRASQPSGPRGKWLVSLTEAHRWIHKEVVVAPELAEAHRG